MRKIIEYDRLSNQKIIESFSEPKLIPLTNLTFLKKLWRRASEVSAKEEREIIREEGLSCQSE